MGFTHIEFLPISEHPFDGSWGYQPTGLFAPTSRFGTPEDFIALVDACHSAGLGVLLDWVPGHFPDDPHGLGRFNGEALYEHDDPRQGRHLDWGTLIYNYGRSEVSNFLLANALFWLDRYGIDGLRVDAVASMLYLDYSRPADAWVPNKHGGRENLDAIEFLRRVNTDVFAHFPQTTTIAEESTAWPMVSRPVDWGGLGFGYKWNMGWMHDTLDYVSKDPSLSQVSPFTKSCSVCTTPFPRISCCRCRTTRSCTANARSSAACRATSGSASPICAPITGSCSATPARSCCSWAMNSARKSSGITTVRSIGTCWSAAAIPACSLLVRDLNRLYRSVPALHELDCEADGFEWLVANDAERGIFAWLRKGREPRAKCLVVVNFSPQVYRGYRIRVPLPGTWREALNTDAAIYGGSNVGNNGGVVTIDDGPVSEVELVIPPLAAVFFVPG